MSHCNFKYRTSSIMLASSLVLIIIFIMLGIVQAGHQNQGYFQYANVPAYGQYEFGYHRGNPDHYTSRYEQAKDWRFRTKVRWGDKAGGYGEHYWDYNHIDKSKGAGGYKSGGGGGGQIGGGGGLGYESQHHDHHHQGYQPSYGGTGGGQGWQGGYSEPSKVVVQPVPVVLHHKGSPHAAERRKLAISHHQLQQQQHLINNNHHRRRFIVQHHGPRESHYQHHHHPPGLRYYL